MCRRITGTVAKDLREGSSRAPLPTTYPAGCRGEPCRRPAGPFPSPKTSWGRRLVQGGRALPGRVLGSAGDICGVGSSSPESGVPRCWRLVAPHSRDPSSSARAAARPHTVRGAVTGVTSRPASGLPRRRARGQLGRGSGFEWGRRGRGDAAQARLPRDAAVTPALQDHLREARGARRCAGWVSGGWGSLGRGRPQGCVHGG